MLSVFLSFFNCIVVSKYSYVHQITIEYKSIKRGVGSMNQIFLPALWNDILLLTSLSRQTIYFFKFYKWEIGECAGLIIIFLSGHDTIFILFFNFNRKIPLPHTH